MRCIFLLSKEDLRLAKEEVLSLFKPKKHKLVENLLFLETDDIKKAARLAYSRKAYKILFQSDKENLENAIMEFDWSSIYNKSFRVRIEKIDQETGFTEPQLAALVWKTLKNPKVNLENPKTSIEFVFAQDKIYATLTTEIKQNFEERKAHKRPELHPTALNPKLARALINLAGAEKEVMDPFCGAGGILIEAGIIGLKSVGYDLYPEMLKKAKKNLDYFNVKGYKLINEDALKIRKRYECVATDVPYGLNTSIWVRQKDQNQKIPIRDKKENLEEFYLKFLLNLKKILIGRAAVIFPHYVDYRRLIKKAGFNVEKEFSQAVHGSLTRKILILSAS